MLSKSIQHMQQKSRGLLLRLIMGLGGHEHWGREEFLANVVLKSGNLELNS